MARKEKRGATLTDFVADFVGLLLERARKAKSNAQTATTPEDLSFQKGRVLAYYEVLSSLRNQLVSFDVDAEKCGFKTTDLEKELLLPGSLG